MFLCFYVFGNAPVLAIILRDEETQEIYSSVHFSTMVGNLVLKIKYF